jgi:two-component system response regulator RegX3
MSRLLLVEDEPGLVMTLTDRLIAEGYEVESATDAPSGLELAATGSFDAILLDVMLPGGNGMDVCRSLRQRGLQTPILMLTAKGQVVDKVVGLKLGADDYLVKPFGLRELIARIRAVLRRTQAAPAEVVERELVLSSPQALGRLVVDRRSQRVLVDDEEIHLTAKEFDLLAFLCEDPGAVRRRTEILEHVWDARWYGPTKTVDAHVAGIRKKLGGPGWVEAVRGVGFRLGPTV